MKCRFVILFLILSSSCFATGQSGELVIYDGDTLEMLSLPLDSFLEQDNNQDRFNPLFQYACSTGLWRGYTGLWKIANNKLILIDIYLCGDKRRSLKPIIFPDPNEVWAEWYTGELYLEKGEIIRYNHTGFDRVYDQEVLLQVPMEKLSQKRTIKMDTEKMISVLVGIGKLFDKKFTQG